MAVTISHARIGLQLELHMIELMVAMSSRFADRGAASDAHPIEHVFCSNAACVSAESIPQTPHGAPPPVPVSFDVGCTWCTLKN